MKNFEHVNNESREGRVMATAICSLGLDPFVAMEVGVPYNHAVARNRVARPRPDMSLCAGLFHLVRILGSHVCSAPLTR